MSNLAGMTYEAISDPEDLKQLEGKPLMLLVDPSQIHLEDLSNFSIPIVRVRQHWWGMVPAVQVVTVPKVEDSA